jgi:hypothetical protein
MLCPIVARWSESCIFIVIGRRCRLYEIRRDAGMVTSF